MEKILAVLLIALAIIGIAGAELTTDYPLATQKYSSLGATIWTHDRFLEEFAKERNIWHVTTYMYAPGTDDWIQSVTVYQHRDVKQEDRKQYIVSVSPTNTGIERYGISPTSTQNETCDAESAYRLYVGALKGNLAAWERLLAPG